MKNKFELILITGGAGFIGSNLSDFLLKKNFKIICLDNFDNFYAEDIKQNNIKGCLGHSSFKLIRGDIRDSELLNAIFTENKIDLVIHLAAKAGVRNSILNPKDYFDVNVNGHIVLLEAMKHHSVTNLIFTSSSSIYGNKIGKLKETDVCDQQISPYAVSKKTSELLNYSYHVNYGFNVLNLRLFSIYGKNQRPDLVLHKFFSQIKRREPIEIYGSGKTCRDYTYIDDAIDAFYNSILFIENKNACICETINIGNNNPISLNLLLDLIKKNLKAENIKVLHQETRKGDADTTHADIEKAKELLHYNPAVSIENGIKLFHDWFKNVKI
jgi:UDP-glucuronate 4-epimerase